MKPNNKVEYNDYKLLKNLEFYSNNDLSKVKSRDEFICEECDLKGAECEGMGVVYFNDTVSFCSRKKTHLSVSILTELIFAYNQKSIFKQFRDLLSDIKDIYVKGLSEKEYVETLCDYDIMVIDDLGATRMSEWEISVLDNIVAKRYNSKKHTIFNSNLAFLNGKNFKATDSNQILDYKIGKRNISRIYEMCHILELKGEDYRISSSKL